jgi:NAD+ diphosphatase
MSYPKLKYADVPLDRADALRRDPGWLAERLRNPDTMVIPVWRDRNMISGVDTPHMHSVACRQEVGARVLEAASEIVFLGVTDNDVALFAADLSACEEEEAVTLAGGGACLDLRRVGPLVESKQASLMAYARGILYWHRQHQYCGRCGHPTESRDGGHRRQCTHTDCAHKTFPRTDPAVIMLVEYRPQDGLPPVCLLGNHHRLPSNVYSTLAGFVEPGESLEETVIREVSEEAGVKVGHVVYQGSQPWPFPSSIMLGFRAQAETTDLLIDQHELKEARWFTADEVRTFGEWGDEKADFCLPRKDSIARFLVASWVAEVTRL